MRRSNLRFLTALGATMVLSFGASSAHAVPLDPGLVIVADVVIDDGDGDLQDVGTNYSATTYNTLNGSTTGGATAVQFLNTGDGVGHTASLDGDNSAVAGLAGDYDITLNNTTADTYEVVMGITFSHSTDAFGGDFDVRSRTRLHVNEAGMNAAADAKLYSRLTSESGDDYAAGNSNWTDQVDDETSQTDLGTNGDLVAFAETRYFAINLLAGGIFDLEGEFFLDGRVFDTGGLFDIESEMFIFVDSCKNLTTGLDCGDSTGPGPGPDPEIPEPSSALLFPVGFGVIAGIARRRVRL